MVSFFGYSQRYETIPLFKSFLMIPALNYQHLLITLKCLKSLKKGLKSHVCVFFDMR